MAGNKKPTKKYRPRGVRLNTMEYVRQGLAPLSKNLRVNLLTKVHDAMVEVTQGRGTFTMQFERYETVPFVVTEQIVAKRREQNKIR